MEPVRPCYVTRPDCDGDLTFVTCIAWCGRRNAPYCAKHGREHDAYCKARAAHPTSFESSVVTASGAGYTGVAPPSAINPTRR